MDEVAGRSPSWWAVDLMAFTIYNSFGTIYARCLSRRTVMSHQVPLTNPVDEQYSEEPEIFIGKPGVSKSRIFVRFYKTFVHNYGRRMEEWEFVVKMTYWERSFCSSWLCCLRETCMVCVGSWPLDFWGFLMHWKSMSAYDRSWNLSIFPTGPDPIRS